MSRFLFLLALVIGLSAAASYLADAAELHFHKHAISVHSSIDKALR